MQDRILSKVIHSVTPLYGDAAGLVVLRALKEIGASPNLRFAGKVQRKIFAEKLSDAVVIPVASPRRAAMYTSKLYRAMEVGKLAALYNNIEGAKWHGRRWD